MCFVAILDRSLRLFGLAALASATLCLPALASDITVASPANGVYFTSPVWIRAHNVGCEGVPPVAFGYSIDDSTTLIGGETPYDIDVIGQTSPPARTSSTSNHGPRAACVPSSTPSSSFPGPMPPLQAVPAPSLYHHLLPRYQIVEDLTTRLRLLRTRNRWEHPATSPLEGRPFHRHWSPTEFLRTQSQPVTLTTITAGIRFTTAARPALPRVHRLSRNHTALRRGPRVLHDLRQPRRRALEHPRGLGTAAATHFVYDTYVFLPNPSEVLNLELDINHVTSNGETWILGTQCSGFTGTWAAAYTSGKKDHWWSSSIKCDPRTWTANTWHHIQIAVHRDANGIVTHDWVVLDGTYYAWNYTRLSAHYLGWEPGTFNVQYQIEGTSKSSSSVTSYVHKMTIYYW